MATYEITFIDTGKTVHWTERRAIMWFGREEWKEVKLGYLPHIVVVKTSQ